MASSALRHWRSRSARVLDELEAAHTAVGGKGAGGRFAAQQVNHAYVVMLCSQFQRFCRDLHTECVQFLTDPATRPDPRLAMLKDALIQGRKLDTGNPNPGNIGADFGRIASGFWGLVVASDPRAGRSRLALDELCLVRNAVAHQDFASARLSGRKTIRQVDLRRWRGACDALATAFDRVAGDVVTAIMGARPW